MITRLSGLPLVRTSPDHGVLMQFYQERKWKIKGKKEGITFIRKCVTKREKEIGGTNASINHCANLDCCL